MISFRDEFQPRSDSLADLLFDIFSGHGKMLAAACKPVAELPPAAVMSVNEETKLVTVCAWCPSRFGQPEMGPRCVKWAADRGMKTSHGLCEVCQKEYFPE